MRLIDANSILHDFLKQYTEMERVGKLVFAACEIKQNFADMISEAPTVVAVPVVRCRDCKHYKPQKKSAHWDEGREMMTCTNCCEQFDLYFKNDFNYCPNCGAKMD